MLDLNKIEANIDKLLGNETPESLSKWLGEHRLKQDCWNEPMSEGDYEDGFKSYPSNQVQARSSYQDDSTTPWAGEINFAMAA